MSDAVADLEPRVRALEEVVGITPGHEESVLVRLIKVETAFSQSEKLVMGVERLGENTQEMNQLLSTVRTNTFKLDNLEPKVEAAVTKVDAAATAHQLVLLRRKMVARIWGGIIVLTFIIIVGALSWTAYNDSRIAHLRERCMQINQTNMAFKDFVGSTQAAAQAALPPDQQSIFVEAAKKFNSRIKLLDCGANLR